MEEGRLVRSAVQHAYIHTRTRTFWFVLPSHDFERILRLLHHDTRHTDERGILTPTHYVIIAIVAVAIIHTHKLKTNRISL